MLKIINFQYNAVEASGFTAESQIEDQVTKYCTKIAKRSSKLLNAFVKRAGQPPTSAGSHEVIRDLNRILSDLVVLAHCTGIELPDEESDVAEIVENLADEVTLDKVLTACVVVSASTEFLLSYFVDPEDTETLAGCIYDTLAALSILYESSGTSLAEALRS